MDTLAMGLRGIGNVLRLIGQTYGFSYCSAGFFPSVTKIKTRVNPDFDFD